MKKVRNKKPRTSGMAITALVIGILSIVLIWFPFLNLILPILAIIFGAIGLAVTRKKYVSGAGMALAGLILGILSLTVLIILTLWFVGLF